MTTVFVSGSRKLGRLNPRVRERVDNIVRQGFSILVGDANGADKALQTYLYGLGYPDVTVYCAGDECRNNVGEWRTVYVSVPSGVRGRKFYSAKDKAMAEIAEIAFVLWDGASAGALENILEMLRRKKKAVVYFSPRQAFATVATPSDLRALLSECGPENLAAIDSKIGLRRHLRELEGETQPQLGL